VPLPRVTHRLSVLAVAVLLTACTSSKPHPAPTSSPASISASVSSSPAVSTPSVTPTPTASAKPIAFSDCSNQFQTAIGNAKAKTMTFSCGKLSVPLDYSQPAGKDLQLFVVKVHSKSQRPADRIGSLLVNPGGPGGSGVNLAAGLVGALSDTLLDHFDLVGFDPRGVGLSQPVQCITDKEKDQLAAADPDPRTAAGRAAARASSVAVVHSCVAAYGRTLAHFNTDETARDMELIRQSLGDPKLNYLGFSYGTRLGAVYAHEFPTHVRAAVLDGAVDPVADELTTDERQTKAFEGAFDQFAADCVGRPACAVLGNPRQVVEALIAAADKTPIRSSKQGETRTATGGIVTIAVVSALYEQSRWATLGSALVAARRGDSAGLFTLADGYLERDADGHYANILDANLAVNCNDSRLKVTDALVAAQASTWVAKYPIFGKNAAASLYSCYSWPASGHPLPPATAPTSSPILVIGTVHDPATPYAAAGVLAKTLGSGTVLSWDGEGHTAYPKTSCIRTKVDSYLITDKLPSGDSCPLS
jgi:pimeloyl-ACP methyl ester carboxylesterase